ncbi:hypothetical protein [Pseudanabaena sp. PCC 6802]|nr:hypothetical protein [Pseudanabaena sp. PCC 6802]
MITSKAGDRIKIVQGDITQQALDAMVNQLRSIRSISKPSTCHLII